MSIIKDSLPILDKARALLADVGLRPYTVSVLVRTWVNGDRVGTGNLVETETPLTVADGRPPKVRQLSAKELVAQGGALEDQTFEVGPLTPDYGVGGTQADTLNPPMGEHPQEVFYVLKGPGLSAAGALCQKQLDRLRSEEHTS